MTTTTEKTHVHWALTLPLPDGGTRELLCCDSAANGKRICHPEIQTSPDVTFFSLEPDEL
jgi:hypothetical protein